MHSMTQGKPLVVGGVDSHADSHHAAALDERGQLLSTSGFATTTSGYRQLLRWLTEFGSVEAVAVESTGAYAAGLVRFLRSRDVRVVEVNRPHAHTRRRVGKSDPIDAEMAARLFLAGKAKAIPKQTDGIVESIRMLRAARNSAVKSRSAALVQIRDLIITAPQPLRQQLSERKTLRGKAVLCGRFRIRHDLVQPSEAAKFALRSLARRIEALDHEIASLDSELEQLVATAAPRTTQLLGISTGHAGQLLVTAGQNIDRLLKGDASFAALCGSSPIPASSGKTTRHRLNYGGDRRANSALHLIAVCRLRCCPRTRAYAQRRAREGKTKREIIRCLKRYIAREVYNSLRADLADLQPPQHHPVTVTITCGNPGSGITRKRA